ncbi:MAG: hypothetical protein ACTSVV_17775 [Promethearchaeota archaeon]
MEKSLELQINKEWDYSFWYEMAHQAYKTKDLKQAIKISEKALEDAKKNKNNQWIEKFDLLHSNAKRAFLRMKVERYLKRAAQEENIFAYGKAIHFLKKAKKQYNALYKLGKNEEKIKKQIKKIDKKIRELEKSLEMESAGNLLNQNMILIDKGDEYNNFKNNKSELSDLDKNNDQKYLNEIYCNYDDFLREDSNKNEPKINSALEIELDNDLINEAEQKEKEFLTGKTESKTESHSILLDIKENFIEDVNIDDRETILLNDDLRSEKMSKIEFKNFRDYIKKLLKESYFIIPKNAIPLKELRDIDFFVIKHQELKGDIEQIIIFPIKISDLKGNIVINQGKIDYKFVKNRKEPCQILKDTLINGNIDNLISVNEMILNDFISEGYFYKFINKYLKISVNIAKSSLNRQIFFHIGQIEFKLLIEPVLVCKNETGTTEKNVPFPYHKSTNIHIIKFEYLEQLLDFLSEKYRFITEYETNINEENNFKRYFRLLKEFSLKIKAISLPFTILGAINLIFMFSDAYYFSGLLFQLFLGIFFVYCSLFCYIYSNFSKRKSNILKNLELPYFKKKLNLDGTDLLILNERFEPRFKEQFLFECINNIQEVETEIALYDNCPILDKKISEKTIHTLKSSENIDKINQDLEDLELNTENEEIFKKYNSFLED